MSEYEKLPPEFKAKWVAALRSGEFRQARDTLCTDDGYCCLGVACRVAGLPDEFLRGRNYIYEGIREFSVIPPTIRTGNGEPASGRLSVMNDDGKTFAEIADWIEANL